LRGAHLQTATNADAGTILCVGPGDKKRYGAFPQVAVNPWT
jgi:hypothetical protein